MKLNRKDLKEKDNQYHTRISQLTWHLMGQMYKSQNRQKACNLNANRNDLKLFSYQAPAIQSKQ
jgi:hypothetical protein